MVDSWSGGWDTTINISPESFIAPLNKLFLLLWYADVSAKSGNAELCTGVNITVWELGQTCYMLNMLQCAFVYVCVCQVLSVESLLLAAKLCVLVCACFLLFKKNLQLLHWGCLVLPGNQPGLNRCTHNVEANTHTRKHSGGLRTIGLNCSTLHQRRGSERCLPKVPRLWAVYRFHAHARAWVHLPKSPHGFNSHCQYFVQ